MQKKIILGIVVALIATNLLTFIIATNMGVEYGVQEGYKDALTDIKDILSEKGITFSWREEGEGVYVIEVLQEGKVLTRVGTEVHIWVEHWRNGELLTKDYGAGTLTNIGKDFIEQQISGSASTTNAIYVACSADTDSPSSAWTVVGGTTTDELNSNGFTRATGTYTSTGTGTWNVTYTFTATGTQSVQLYGLNWSASSRSDNNLLCADTSSVKNCVNNDTLKVTWQITVT